MVGKNFSEEAIGMRKEKREKVVLVQGGKVVMKGEKTEEFEYCGKVVEVIEFKPKKRRSK